MIQLTDKVVQTPVTADNNSPIQDFVRQTIIVTILMKWLMGPNLSQFHVKGVSFKQVKKDS